MTVNEIQSKKYIARKADMTTLFRYNRLLYLRLYPLTVLITAAVIVYYILVKDNIDLIDK